MRGRKDRMLLWRQVLDSNPDSTSSVHPEPLACLHLASVSGIVDRAED